VLIPAFAGVSFVMVSMTLVFCLWVYESNERTNCDNPMSGADINLKLFLISKRVRRRTA
jgi:hypothetical protein